MCSTKEKARHSCGMLFLEIVTEVIFAVSPTLAINEPQRDELPEDALVDELIKTVTPKEGSTKQLTPLNDSKADNIPVVRSYLLQLLLEYEYVCCHFICV